MALKGLKAGRHWETIARMIPLLVLMAGIKAKWKPGMGWHNYGKGKDKWHIDHIISRDFFQWTSTEDVEFQYCWSLDNLQPLWEQDNLLKGTKSPQEWEEFKRKYPERLYKYVPKVSRKKPKNKRKSNYGICKSDSNSDK